MPTSLTGTLTAAVTVPFQLLRALADLPRMLEQQARLTDELATRFLGGMVVKLDTPDLAANVASLLEECGAGDIARLRSPS